MKSVRHLDLFSGIGGFAYAADQVWGDVEHIFCDNDKFCQQVLNKHWKGSKIYNDIRDITYADLNRLAGGKAVNTNLGGQSPLDKSATGDKLAIDILTGGFPCQPFSQAGQRKGIDDDRYLWPEMLRVIQLAKPSWVIAENVRGLLTMQQGMVFEQVCSDLEDQGYEVQPFVIPAVAVNAPHRRDRIWFVAHALDHQPRQEKPRGDGEETGVSQVDRSEHSPTRESIGTDRERRGQGYAANTNLGESRPGNEPESAKPQQPEHSPNNRDLASNPDSQYEERLEPTGTGPGQSEAETSDRDRNAQDARGVGSGGRSDGDSGGYDREIQDARSSSSRLGWERNWLQVAAEFCSVDDGLPVKLDGFKLTKPQHRAEQLKAYGNAIVPQIAIQIMKGMVL
jgi:DNA (cytosine-5)-methyltransferase 1